MSAFNKYYETVKHWWSSVALPVARSKWLNKLSPKFKKVPLSLPSPTTLIDGAPVKQEQSHACPNYMELKLKFRDIGRMNGIMEALGRDFLTAMPEGAYVSRLGQIAFMARRVHEELANQSLATLIEKSHTHEKKHNKQWDKWDSANLYEMESMYRHHCKVKPELIEKLAKLSYEGRRRHRDILKNNDWDSAKPFLSEMVTLQRQLAESKCLQNNKHKTESAYQALMRQYIPDGKLDDIDVLFDEYEKGLDKLLPKILDKQSKEEIPLPLQGEFPAGLQLWLNKSLLKVLGFDFTRGGLYETGHNPVEGGTPDDTRLVIKTSDEMNFLESMKSAMHEGGHGVYIQGLPRSEWRYQPVGQDLGAAVQESQAFLVEMILGRRKEFFDYLSPRIEGLFQRFGEDYMTADNLYRLKTRVKPTVDRKNADEVTYFYHIKMRMELERDLISGALSVNDLPDAWNAKVKEFCGVEPDNYASGCLQDVHWFVGKFGYYPAYALGHMMAAQFESRMTRDIQNLPELLSMGQFKPINTWLNDNIHAKGRLMGSDALIEEVTGRGLSAQSLLNHLEDRYLKSA